MVMVARCSHNTGEWIDRLFSLYAGHSLTMADTFVSFVIAKGTREQALRLWHIQTDPTKIQHGDPKSLWKLGFDIARRRSDLREDFRDWLQNNCPDDSVSKHDLAKVLGADSVDATNAAQAEILDMVEKSFEKPDHHNPLAFQFYGAIYWKSEWVLPLLDKIETNILQGKCNFNHLNGLLTIMEAFSGKADDLLLSKLSDICSKLLGLDKLTAKSLEIRDRFFSALMFGHDPEANVVRRLLGFVENLFDHGGMIVPALVRYVKKNYVSLAKSSNIPYLARILLKLLVKDDTAVGNAAPVLLSFLEITVQSLFAAADEYSETDITNTLRTLGIIFDSSETNHYSISRIPESSLKSQILELFEGLLTNSAQCIYPSTREAACDMLFRWKRMACEQNGGQVVFSDSFHAILEKLKDDPHARVRFAYEKHEKQIAEEI